VVGVDRDADAGVDVERDPLEDQRLGESVPELLRHQQGSVGVVHGLEEDTELVATESGDAVVRAHLCLETLADLFEE